MGHMAAFTVRISRNFRSRWSQCGEIDCALLTRTSMFPGSQLKNSHNLSNLSTAYELTLLLTHLLNACGVIPMYSATSAWLTGLFVFACISPINASIRFCTATLLRSLSIKNKRYKTTCQARLDFLNFREF